MFGFSAWISESRGSEDVVNGGPDMMVDAKSSQLLGQMALITGKRKRDDLLPPQPHHDRSPEVKRVKAEPMEDHAGLTAPANGMPLVQVDAYTGVQALGRVQEAIDSQLSLEILLKHEEMRQINQELAKCQAAYEQLRRCHLIPYPGIHGVSQDISYGLGPSIAQGDVRPQWAAPFGVTESPYSRHYAKWLIPDPSFDGVQPDPLSRAMNGGVSEGRPSRQGSGGKLPAGRPRTHRGSSGQKLQALPSGYTQSKENAGPSILKRGDGQMVKLVCIDCNRENFGSTQGYINHCRIAHHREFKSHEEAAVRSGVPIELDEAGGIVGDERSVPVATGLVHPLIRSAPTDKEAYAALLSRISTSLNMYHEGKLPGVTSIPGSVVSTPVKPCTRESDSFIPSSETPYLSNLLRSRGFDRNLGEIVTEAKKVTVFDDVSSHSEDSETEKQPQSRPFAMDGTADTPVPAMRTLARCAMSPAPLARPGSSKGPETSRKLGISPRLPYATPINTTSAINHNRPTTTIINSHDISISPSPIDDDIMMHNVSMIDLSPNTVASNNAPSLVSDDGEYDDEGDDHSEISQEELHDESDVAEIDFEDGDGESKVGRVTVQERERAGSVRLRKEDKHVTFVSPVKDGAKVKAKNMKG
jgi:hypothetical protein